MLSRIKPLCTLDPVRYRYPLFNWVNKALILYSRMFYVGTGTNWVRPRSDVTALWILFYWNARVSLGQLSAQTAMLLIIVTLVAESRWTRPTVMAQISIVMAVDGTRWSAPPPTSTYISGLGTTDLFRVISRTAPLQSIQAIGYCLCHSETFFGWLNRFIGHTCRKLPQQQLQYCLRVCAKQYHYKSNILWANATIMLSQTLYLTKKPQAATGRERLPFMEQGTSFIHQKHKPTDAYSDSGCPSNCVGKSCFAKL